MMAVYCWSIKQDCPQIEHPRKSYKRKFLSKLLANNVNYSNNILNRKKITVNKHYSQTVFF